MLRFEIGKVFRPRPTRSAIKSRPIIPKIINYKRLTKPKAPKLGRERKSLYSFTSIKMPNLHELKALFCKILKISPLKFENY